MFNFRKLVSVSAVAVLGVTNLLTPLSYANAATGYDVLSNEDLKQKVLHFMMPNKDVYLYANTEANKYFVTYSGTTKTSGEMSGSIFTYDETGTLTPNAYEKTGYTFTKWNTQPNGSGTDHADQGKVWNWTAQESGTVPIYAQWSANRYLISYDLNDTAGTSRAVHSGEPSSGEYDQMLDIANPTRTGYGFSGWNISNMDSEAHIVGGQASSATTATEVTGTGFKNLNSTNGETVGFQAQWSPNTDTEYKVEHYKENLDGSGWTKVETDDLQGTTDTEVKPSAKHYEGFTDATPTSGNIDADGNTVFRYEYPRNSYNLTLTAGRGVSLVEGSGSVNTSGGSTNDTTVISFRYQEPVSLAFTLKPGYATGVWTGSDADTSTFTMPASHISRTASATPIVYTITYDTKGGTVSGNPASYTVESDDITLKNPTRLHSTFAGWTGGVVSGDQLAGATKTVKIASGSIGNRTYTATWTCHNGYHLNDAGTECMPDTDTEYYVRHYKQDLDGTYNVEPIVVTQTGTTDTETNATPIDYEGFEVVSIGTGIITGNVEDRTTVDIQYRRLDYNGTVANPAGVLASSITANLAGAHPTGTAGTYKYGDTVTLSATLETGYEFNGWTMTNGSGTNVTSLLADSTSLNTTFTMPANSVTITPNITKVTYDITYELNNGALTGGATNPLSYNVETATFTLNNPERDNSVFVGWSGTKIDGTSTTVTIAKGSVGDRSYEAIWDCKVGYHKDGNSCVANTYHVVVVNEDGEGHSSPDDIVFTYDSGSSLPRIPEQSGYDFAGWIVEGMSGGVTHYIGEITVTGDDTYVYSGTSIEFMNLTVENGGTVTLTARWTPRDDTKYTVYHYYRDINANTYTLSGTDHLEGTTDTEVVFSELLKNKSGFTYTGGYLTGGTSRPTSGAVTTGNIDKHGTTEIYLYYDRNKRHVYLSGDAHVNTLIGENDYDYGDDVTVDMTAKTGYHFKTWEKKDSF